MMNDITFFLGFFSFIQLSVALNFGLLFLTKSHTANKLQKEWIEYLKYRFRKDIKDAKKEYSRVREGMDEMIKGQKLDLENHVKAFSENTDNEDLSVFMPEIGLTSGIYGMFLLLLLPTWAKGDLLLRSDLWAILTQTLLFYQCVNYFSLRHRDKVESWGDGFRKLMNDKWKRREMLFILAIISIIVFSLFFFFGATCHCLTPELILYLSIITAYSPILFYVVSLYELFRHRKKMIVKIRVLTSELKMMLDKRNK